MKILDEMKEKCSSDYTLTEQIVAAMTVALTIVCFALVLVLIVAAICMESWVCVLLAIIAVLSGAVFMAVWMYIDPDW